MEIFEHEGHLVHDSSEEFRKGSEEDKFVVTLASSSIDNWGASVNFDDDWSQWKVQTVDQDKQLARKGVDVGFRIRGVDGKILNQETQWTLRVFLETGLGCEIEFDTWRKSSIEREESAMTEEMNRLVRSQSNHLRTKASESITNEALLSENKNDLIPSGPMNVVNQNFSCNDQKSDREDDDIFESLPIDPKANEDLESVKIGLKLVWNEINKLKECYNGLNGVIGRMNSRLSNVESLLQTKISKIKEAENTLSLCSKKVAARSKTWTLHDLVAV